jgi:hypothetical protein
MPKSRPVCLVINDRNGKVYFSSAHRYGFWATIESMVDPTLLGLRAISGITQEELDERCASIRDRAIARAEVQRQALRSVSGRMFGDDYISDRQRPR